MIIEQKYKNILHYSKIENTEIKKCICVLVSATKNSNTQNAKYV